MSVAEIKAAVSALPSPEARELLAWMAERDNAQWDKQIEADLNSGRLDALLDAVNAEYKPRRLVM